MRPPTPLDFEDQCFQGLSTTASSNPAFPHAPVDTAALWNHQSYQCILLGMNFMGEIHDAKSQEQRPQPRVADAVINRLKEGNKKLPPHELWLQENVGMGHYAKASTPAGWVA